MPSRPTVTGHSCSAMDVVCAYCGRRLMSVSMGVLRCGSASRVGVPSFLAGERFLFERDKKLAIAEFIEDDPPLRLHRGKRRFFSGLRHWGLARLGRWKLE